MAEQINVFDNVLECIGNTPAVRLGRLAGELQSEVYAKLEFMNPGGSVKDRIARHIVRRAEERGEIVPGGTIVEATSGNTGLGLAMAAVLGGYDSTFVMPDKQSMEKVQALRAFGSRVVVTPTAVEPEDPRSYYSVSRKEVEDTPNSFYANQYHNPDNPETHYLETGPEIWRQLAGEIDVFVAGMGTGGTLSGVGKYLKEQNPEIKIVGVDPVGSIYYDLFKTGKMTEAYSYSVEGIGEDFLPSTMDLSVLDDVVRVTDRECYLMTRDLVRREGIFCGGSGGAAVAGAMKWLKQHDRPGQKVLILLPDTGRQYLGKIFNDDWMRENGYLDDVAGSGTVADLLNGGERSSVFTVEQDRAIREVAALMRDQGVSQVPVMDGDAVIGIVTEAAVLAHLLDHPGAAQEPVSKIVVNSYSVVDRATRIGVLADMFTRVKIALVMENGSLVDVVTKIDVIDYVSKGNR
ncbi:MAG: pyridoxal-5'-phosphate-dependent protein subunit beta [Rickettsiales bacterium]|nr:pyridoxal-5'-phosphate-dependent protein subunit beta [Rickettsiales bacterium]|tara:strand:- start:3180 stop:4565 length:1386 start_codon:yes stop_codon:yes gene_type:complete